MRTACLDSSLPVTVLTSVLRTLPIHFPVQSSSAWKAVWFMPWELSGQLCPHLRFSWLMDEELEFSLLKKKIPPFRSCIFFSYPVLSGFIENTLQLPASCFCTLQNSRTKFNLVTESQRNKHRACFLERWASTNFKRSQKVLCCSVTSKLEFILQCLVLRVKPEMQIQPCTFRE